MNIFMPYPVYYYDNYLFMIMIFIIMIIIIITLLLKPLSGAMETNCGKSGVKFITRFLTVAKNGHDVPHPLEMHMYTIS